MIWLKIKSETSGTWSPKTTGGETVAEGRAVGKRIGSGEVSGRVDTV